MNYTDKKVFITGANGFLGKAIATRLEELDADVYKYTGDVRDKQRLTELLDQKWDYVFHFGCPSSQVLFQRQRRFCIETTVQSFLHLTRLCALNGIKLVYPSTGLLSQGTSNEYARCKQVCEDLAATPDLDSLGLRIFATYGPGEAHKRDYASVPYLFARDALAGKSPVIWGDGNQSRDFIYIADLVEAVCILAEECPDKVIDVGSGQQTSFNGILEVINDNLTTGHVEGDHLIRPTGYVEETLADISRLKEFYTPKVLIDDGIKKVMESIRRKSNA